MASLSSEKYTCTQTDYDTFLKYSLLDAWRHKPEFPFLVRSATIKRIALDRLSIGWNGTSIADTTDISKNNLLQDVNKGWLQHIRDNKAAAVLKGAKIHKGGDYENLDAAVFDTKKTLISSWYQKSDLVLICGANLVTNKYVGLLNSSDAPTERIAKDSFR